MSRHVVLGRVRPELYSVSLHAAGETIAEALGEVIADVVAIESKASPEGGEILQVALVRPTHVEAFEEVRAAVERAGYSMLEAEVGEIVDEAAEGAIVGLLGGGASGALSKSPIVALVGAAAGWWAGREVGASAKKLGAVYRYRFFPAAGWRYEEILGAGETKEGTPPPRATLGPWARTRLA